MTKTEKSAKEMAEAIHKWLTTDLGLAYMTALQTKYNDQHHKAELENMTPDQRAYYIAYAAGIKFAMEWLASRKINHETGYFDDK